MLPSRQEAFDLLHEHIAAGSMIKHCLASEAVMRALAQHVGEDEDLWGLCGLLHDLDVEETRETPDIHGKETVKILRGLNYPEEMLIPIALHNDMAAERERNTLFEHALAAGETITGLISATAMIYPSRKLADVKVKSITKRMKEKAFAASVSREHILECERIGLPLHDFASIALGAMQGISDELGL